jgi:ABC-type dipeptide/oligopeptide/nickel transport system permease subunit
MTRRRSVIVAALGVLILAGLAVMVVIGLRIPVYWVTQTWAGGFINGTIGFPPFPPLSTVQVFPLNNPQPQLQTHYYLLGSDAGGRDLFALTARGALPSLELVGLALIGRMALGLIAGFGIALGATPLRAVARAAGGWIAGFPYLALAVLVIQALTGGPGTQGEAQPGTTRLIAFVIAIGVVGWRDIAEVVSGRILWVETQPFAMGARAVGSSGLGFFRRHVWPYLRPALTVEFSFQASAVLVLLAELGFLQYYVGGFTSLSEDTQGVAGFHLAIQPELGQLLSDVRLYDLRQQFAPVLVPALALALAALAFEVIGRAMRGRADLPT